MSKKYTFEAEKIKKIELEDYSENEFAIGKLGFLSTRPNSHKLDISEDILREYAPSVLGKFLIADMTYKVDATTHTDKQTIQGYIPKDQDVEFIYDEDGYLRAYVDVVISKVYSSDFVNMFDNDNNRSVSVEMMVEMENPNEDTGKVKSFNIAGVTVLGHAVRPSCPQSDIEITRFSEDSAEKFYCQIDKNGLAALKKFEKERKNMAEKTYKIDKSKEAMSDNAWGDVDKTELRNKILDAANTDKLVKAVYLLVESDWKERPSEALKYPVMELKGDTFVYNRNALSSALAYAKQENEVTVINKLKKIYKSLDLEEEGKEEPKKMSEVNFEAVDVGNLWCSCWDAMRDKNEWDYEIVGMYEEDNQKFAILRNRDGKLYRWNFSLTAEEGFVGEDEITEVEFVATEKTMKFAEPENVAEYRFEEKADDGEEEEDIDYEAERAKLTADIEERDNIIMERDGKIKDMECELEELRAFKAGIEAEQKKVTVMNLLAEVKPYFDAVKLNELRKEGIECENIDIWCNSVKAVAFEAQKSKKIVKSEHEDDGLWRMSAPINIVKSNKGLWD